MSLKLAPMRMGHSEGHTDVCYNDTGKYLLTCGTDGDIRIWEGLEDDDPKTIDVGETTSAVCIKGKRIFTATEANTVQAYDFPDGNPDGILCRFTAPVTHICVSEDGSKLVACAADFTIKLVDLEEESSQKVFEGHTAPVLTVSLDPKLEYLASTSCDGSLKIWQIEDQSWEKSVQLFPKCSDTGLAKTLARVVWEPKTGEFLAVATEKEIQVFERDSWDLAFTLKPGEEMGGFISVLAWDKSGDYIISGGSEGHICLWDVTTRKCIKWEKHKKRLSICGLAWNPKKASEIAYTDIMGQVGVLQDVIDPGSGPQKLKASAVEDAPESFGDLFDDIAEEDLLEAVSQAEGQKATETGAMNTDFAMDAENDLNDGKNNLFDFDQKSRDGSTADIDDGTSSVGDLTEAAKKPLPPVAMQPKTTPLQKPFIPSSTPQHLSSRFMKWNSLGIIRCYDNEEDSSIDVEFHDTSVHHAIHFDNQLNHTMADLSHEAVVLACESEGEVSSQLVCHHFASWDSQNEWTIAMPTGENIKTLALGGGWVAMGTDKRLVRVFTLSGLQRELLALPGPVVCLAGHGKQLMVVYHKSAGLPGDQCLGIKIISISTRKSRQIIGDANLPLSPKSVLIWLGFSAEGTPATVDSEGVVRFLNRDNMSWVPIANTKSLTKGKSDNYWIIGINESPQQLRCVLCKGSTFPPTLPRPTPAILPFQLPFCDIETDKGVLEETFWRTYLMSRHMSRMPAEDVNEMAKQQAERNMQDSIMKIFALSCRTDREQRAADICKFMTSEHAWNLAIKYATRSRKLNLAQRLGELALQILHGEDEDEDDDDDDEIEIEANTRKAKRRQEEDDDEDDEEAEESENGEEVEVEEEEDTTAPFKQALQAKQNAPPKSMLPSSQTKKNPFKKQSAPAPTPAPTPSRLKGASVFDQMKKKSPGISQKKQATLPAEKSKGKKKTQTTLKPSSSPKADSNKENDSEKKLSVPKKPQSAFNCWLEENRSALKEENSDADDADIVKIAIKRWRELDANTKQLWTEKANGRDTTDLEKTKVVNGSLDKDLTQEKKRKREGLEDEDNEVLGRSQEKKAKSIKNSKMDKAVSKVALTSATNNKLSSFAFKKD